MGISICKTVGSHPVHARIALTFVCFPPTVFAFVPHGTDTRIAIHVVLARLVGERARGSTTLIHVLFTQCSYVSFLARAVEAKK